MDIHRCRFIPYPPSPINAIAFSNPHASNLEIPVRAAIGRANGDIEIWNPLRGAWHQESILHGGKDRSIDGLVWVNEPDQVLPDTQRMLGKSRLFSIGYTSTVTEWDLVKRRPKKQASGTHGDIWCLAAQPFADAGRGGQKANGREAILSGKRLVAGTVDGSLLLYSIDDDDLRFDRVLAKSTSKKTQMVSIVFQNRNHVVVGCSDSAIRVYDMRNGSMIRMMTLGSDLAGGTKDIIVWSVKCLKGKDIVSGDSTGQVRIWDGKNYTQTQRIQSHNQDVLSLATSADGSIIVSGGMDKKTILYRQNTNSRWSKVFHRRYHSHDVKAMACFEGPGVSVIVSGGPDASPIVLPLKEAGKKYHRGLSQLPHHPPLQSAPRARLIVSWWDRQVHIWQMRSAVEDLMCSAGSDTNIASNHKLLKQILIQGEANITAVSISNDGSLLFVSTASDVKVFHLTIHSSSKNDVLKISKLDIPPKIAALGATGLRLSPDGSWLCIVQEGTKVSLLRISHDPAAKGRPMIQAGCTTLARIERRMPTHLTLGGFGEYNRSITQITFSPDSKMLAVADIGGYIDTWTLFANCTSGPGTGTDDVSRDGASSSGEDSGSEDETGVEAAIGGEKWSRSPNVALLPRMNSALTLLSFSDHIPSLTHSSLMLSADQSREDYVLLAISARSQLLTLHPTIGALTPWTRRNPDQSFPVVFRNILDLVKGALWSGDRVWLYGNNFLYMIDMSQNIVREEDMPQQSTPGQRPFAKKRKRGDDTGAGTEMKEGAEGLNRIERHIDGERQVFDLDRRAPNVVDIDTPSRPAYSSYQDDSDDEDEREQGGELSLRRKAEVVRPKKGHRDNQPAATWHTFKYRPILGIVALQSTNGSDKGRETLEVALVERPAWDVKLPERYVGQGKADK